MFVLLEYLLEFFIRFFPLSMMKMCYNQQLMIPSFVRIILLQERKCHGTIRSS